MVTVSVPQYEGVLNMLNTTWSLVLNQSDATFGSLATHTQS